MNTQLGFALALSPIVVAVAATACSSSNKTTAGPETALQPSDAGVDAQLDAQLDSGGGAGLPPLGPDDVDPDFPLPLASGPAPTPPMGWNSWNTFQTSVSEQLIEQVADTIVSTGMSAAGFQYVNIDDGWSLAARDASGNLQPGPNFPDGIQAVAAYVHGKGLKLGIYGDRGTATCGGRAGSQGYEVQDATTFAAWGVDYLKYDNCSANSDLTVQKTQYQTMEQALQTAAPTPGHGIVFSVCAWNFYDWELTTGQLWRTTTDIQDEWIAASGGSVLGNLLANAPLAGYASPNHWNDPDMLEVGNGNMVNGTTDVEDQSHFSLWAISAAPLIAGNDVRSMRPTTQAILTNTEVIALDQDALGLQGVEVLQSGSQSVWAKPLNASGARGVVLLNAGPSPANVAFSLPDIGLRSGTAQARDLVAHADLGAFQNTYTAMNVPSHGTVSLKITGVEPPRPYGTAFLSDLIWTYDANGLGNAHKDEANNTSAAVSGTPISIRGTQYAKGLGVSSPSIIIYRLAQKCTSFTATVGVDDSSSGAGTVDFQVFGDDTLLFDSMVVTGSSPAQSVNVDLTGLRRLKLVVGDGGDGTAEDRASWANAQVVCAPM